MWLQQSFHLTIHTCYVTRSESLHLPVTIVKWKFYFSETRKSGFESESYAVLRFAESHTLRNGVICYGFLKTILLLVYCKIPIASLWHITRLKNYIRTKLAKYQFQKHWKNSHQFEILHILQIYWQFSHTYTTFSLIFYSNVNLGIIVLKGKIFISCHWHYINCSSGFSAVILKARHEWLRNQAGIIQNT
jgi:hypothetical protein